MKDVQIKSSWPKGRTSKSDLALGLAQRGVIMSIDGCSGKLKFERFTDGTRAQAAGRRQAVVQQAIAAKAAADSKY